MGEEFDHPLAGTRAFMVELSDGVVQEPPFRAPQVPAPLRRAPKRVRRLLLRRAMRRARLDHAWRVAEWWAAGRPPTRTRIMIPRGYINPESVQQRKTETGAHEYSFSFSILPTNSGIIKKLFG